MLEIGDTCRLKGEKRKTYTVQEAHLNDDGTLKGYHIISDQTACNHWIYADRIKPPKKKKGRKKRPKSS